MAVYIGQFLELLSDLFVQAFVSPWQMVQSNIFSSSETDSIHRPKRRRRSIVRLIGTYLPLPSAPRVYLNLAAWNSCPHSYTSSITLQDQLSEKDELETSNEGSSQLGRYETEAAIKVLQEELHELRLQIAAILENQSNSVKDVVRDVSVLTDSDDDIRLRQQSSVPPPPPPMPPALPPPPPPPLPPAADMASKGIQIVRKKEPKYNGFNSSTPTTPSAMHILGQVLTEMKNGRPKLRPVQRSPGGRPLKKIKTPKTDPSDVLTEVLRRRFSVAQMSDSTNESDTSSQADFASSPDWKTCVT